MNSLDFDFERIAFREFYDAERDTLKAALESFKSLIDSLLFCIPEVAISSSTGRIKTHDECISKFIRKYRAALESTKTPYTIRKKITDLIGLRVVCLYEDDVERIQEAICAEFDVLDVTDKIAQVEGTEDLFGYKGLHLDLMLNDARKGMAEYRPFADYTFELQIRTVVQDAWSIVDHKIKYKKSIPNELKRRINTLAALFELADREFREIRDATTAELEQTKEPYDDVEVEAKTIDGSEKTTTETDPEIPPRKYAPLNAFNFLRIAQHFFRDFKFDPQQVDAFTQEIVMMSSNISRGKFNFYLRETITDVKQYFAESESAGEIMSPFDVMRHCLYAGDSQAFASMLADADRNKFEHWRSEQK